MPQKKQAPPKKPMISGGLPTVPKARTDDDWMKMAAAQDPDSAVREGEYAQTAGDPASAVREGEYAPPLPRGVGPGTDDSLAIPFNPGMMRNPYKYGIPAMKNIALPGGQQDIPLPKKKK